MPLDYSTDRLISRVQTTLQLRNANAKVTPAQILEICDEEIQQNLFPSLMTVREDYQEATTVVLLQANIGQYRLPFSVSSSTIDHIDVVQLSGSTPIGQRMLSRIEVPRMASFTGSPDGAPRAYALMGDTVHVLPPPDTTAAANYVLVIYHEYRPGRLVQLASCAEVQSVALASPFLAMTLTAPLATSGLAVGDTVDFVPKLPPLMPFFVTGSIVDDSTDPVIGVTTNFSTTPETVAAQFPTSGGGYLTPFGYTCVFPLPDAWWSAAVLACSAAVARVTGQADAYGVLRPEADAAIARLVQMQSNRARKQPHIVFDPNSPNRRTGWGTWRGSF